MSEAINELRRRGEVLVPNLSLALAVRREAEAQDLSPVIVSEGPAEGTRVHLQLTGPGARMPPRSDTRGAKT